MKENRRLLNIKPTSFEIRHSSKEYVEEGHQLVINAELQLGEHSYVSNWVVSDCRYDVLLGMPWHIKNNPKTDYENRTVSVGNTSLPTLHNPEDGVKIQNLGVKKFRSLLRKKKHNSDDFVVYRVQIVNNLEINNGHAKVSNKDPEDEDLKKLKKEFKSVFTDELPTGLPPKRDVDHKIEVEPGSTPPHRGMYQLSPAELLATKEYITDLLRKKKIRPSKSPYGAPLFFVKQKGGLRGVIDYRALNRITKHNDAPIPRTDEMFDRLGQAVFYSKLDLKTGFHQIRIAPGDEEKTAFKTRYGHFEFLVMPMGLRNAPATFQALMNAIFRDCIDEFVVIYLDDILVFSDSREEHLNHLRIVLTRLRDNQLYIGNKKYELMQEETEFVGLVVGKSGIKVGEDRKALIKDWPTPTNITELRSFLGLVQFFRRFIKDFSKIAAPLSNLTRKNSSISNWNSTCDDSFQTLKDSLISAPVMKAPDWSRPFLCHTDACQLAVGGTLTQKGDNGEEHAISFFSKRLSPAEENYSANDRELLGLVYFLQRFRCYLEGTSFEVFTDNQVLRHFFSKQSLSRRETRWLEYLGQFGISNLTLVKGRIHVLGDTPSRAPHVIDPTKKALLHNVHITVPELSLPADFRTNYKTDPTFRDIHRTLNGEQIPNAVQRDRISRLLSHFNLNDGLLYYEGQLCVPRQNIKTILQLAHDNHTAGHFGYSKTLARLKNYHWKNKALDVQEYCRGCFTCQQNKDGRTKPLGVPQPLELPDRRWGSVSMDFVTHLPTTANGNDCIITFVDRFTKRIHLVSSHGTDSAVDVADHFFNNAFRLHGLPDSIVSDRDPKFTSKFWNHLMSRCGIKLKMSTSRHPQTDGATEVMNRMVGNYLRCYCTFHQRNWDRLLSSAEFAYNSAEIESLRTSPFELDLGWSPKSPLEALSSVPEDTVHTVNEFKTQLKESFKSATFAQRLAQARQAAYNAKRYRPPSYRPGDEVFLSRKLFTDSSSAIRPSQKLCVRKIGPFKVTSVINKNAVRLELPPNIKIHPVVHVEHTTPAHSQPTDISHPRPVPSKPYTDDNGDTVIEIAQILSHRRRGRGWQFLALAKYAPSHEAEWLPLNNFIDSDGTITQALHSYITQHGILPHLH